VLRVPLNENSISVQLRIDQTSANLLQRSLSAAAPQAASPYRSAQVVLDSVRITGSGDIGGYFYHLYLNLPSSTDVSSATSYRIGSIGPFEIAGAQHRVHMQQEPGGSEAGTVALRAAKSSGLARRGWNCRPNYRNSTCADSGEQDAGHAGGCRIPGASKYCALTH
jgi:hypothetical protein